MRNEKDGVHCVWEHEDLPYSSESRIDPITREAVDGHNVSIVSFADLEALLKEATKNEQRSVAVAMMSQLARETKQRSKAPAMPGTYALVGHNKEGHPVYARLDGQEEEAP
jgi:hypothetical protein